jgi:aminopeptidase YwaD
MPSIFEHLTTLTNFGPRPIGSPANRAAARYIAQTFGALGLQVEEQPYPCVTWKENKTVLQVENHRLDAAANAFSPPCQVIAAPVTVAGTLRELEQAPVKGNILLLHGDLARAPLSPKGWFLKDERDDSIIQFLEANQPAAILAPPTATDYLGQLTEDWELNLAAATISTRDALRIMSMTEPRATLTIDSERHTAQAGNVVARLRPQVQKRIVLCAHFDTKINTPGASDNAGGVAILLGLAERLSKIEAGLGVEFVAFDGEEYLPIGDETYLERAQSYFADIQCAINIDGAGTALGTTSCTALAMPEEQQAALRTLAEKMPGVMWIEPWYESNHSSFAMRGIPAVALSAIGTRALAHQPHDTPEQMSEAKLEEAAELASHIATMFG